LNTFKTEHIVTLPRISVILNFEEQICDKTIFKRIFDYGIIETYTLQCNWKTNTLDKIDYMAFKILLANPDEIYSFLQKIKKYCWKMECWLIRRKKPPKIIYARFAKGDDIIEEDYFWELDFELYDEYIFQ